MKLLRYDRNGAVRLGALDEDYVVGLLGAGPTGAPTADLAALSDMRRLVAAGEGTRRSSPH